MQIGQSVDDAKVALLDIMVADNKITEEHKQEILSDSVAYRWEVVKKVVPDLMTVKNITPDVSGKVPVDSDGDGIIDSWEIANGLNPNDGGDSILDNDGDGYLNIEEYLNWLVP